MQSIILGMPWLESVNPVIDWHRKTILSYFVHDVPAFSPPTSSESTNLVSLCEATMLPSTPIKCKSKCHRSKRRRSPLDYEPKPPKLPPKVRLTRQINSNDEVYLLHLDEIHSLPEYLSAIQEVTPETPDIPEEYRDLAEVFSKSKSEE